MTRKDARSGHPWRDSRSRQERHMITAAYGTKSRPRRQSHGMPFNTSQPTWSAVLGSTPQNRSGSSARGF